MRRRKFVRKSKYEDNAVLINSTIQKIDIQNEEIGDKYKNVFYIKSNTYPEGRMCILWGESSFEVGDNIVCAPVAS